MATSTSRLNRVSARQVREALTFAEGDVIAFGNGERPTFLTESEQRLTRSLDVVRVRILRSSSDAAHRALAAQVPAGRRPAAADRFGRRARRPRTEWAAATNGSGRRVGDTDDIGLPRRAGPRLRQGVAQPGRDHALPVLGHDEGPTASESAPTEYARDVERDWTGRLRGNGGPPRHSECRQGVSLTCRRAPYQSAASSARNGRAPRPRRRRDRRAALPRCATRRGCSSAPGDVETDGTMTSSSPSAARSRTRPAHGLTFAGRPLRGRDPPSARRSGAGTPRPRRRSASTR